MISHKKNSTSLLFICCIFFILVLINPISSSEPLEKTLDETYYTYDQLTDLLSQLENSYPDTFSYSSLGKTYQDRDIWLVKISDNVTIEEDEPEILFTGGVHGDEKQGYQVVIYTLKAIAENYSNINVNSTFTNRIRNIVNNTQLFFMPMVNPDGCEAGTRKNLRQNDCLFGKTLFKGVDINRNSGYKWELLDENPFEYRRSGFPPVIEKINIKYPHFDFKSMVGEGCYRGPYPFSEPESQSIKSVVENHSFTISIDYHSAADMVGYGWAWNGSYPIKNETTYSSIADNISGITGYTAKRGSLYPILGTIRDWMYAEHDVFSLCIELPHTKGDAPIRHLLHNNGHIFPWKNVAILDLCKTNFEVNLYVAEKAIMLNCKSF